MVDVGVVPHLLLALDHATGVVVGANATVDWRPRRGVLERGGDRPADSRGLDGPHCVRGSRIGLL